MYASFSLADISNPLFDVARRDMVDISPIIFGYVRDWQVTTFFRAAARLPESEQYRGWRLDPAHNPYYLAVCKLLEFCEEKSPDFICGAQLTHDLKLLGRPARRSSSKRRRTICRILRGLCACRSCELVAYCVLDRFEAHTRGVRARGAFVVLAVGPFTRAVIYRDVMRSANAKDAIPVIFGMTQTLAKLRIAKRQRRVLYLTFTFICETHTEITGDDVLHIARALKRWNWEYKYILTWMLGKLAQHVKWPEIRVSLIRAMTARRFKPVMIKQVSDTRRNKQRREQ